MLTATLIEVRVGKGLTLRPGPRGAALLGVLTATLVEFHKVSPNAAYALVPYYMWSTYAAALTASIYRRNPHKRGHMSDRAAAAAEGAARDVAGVVQARGLRQKVPS